MKKYKVVTCEGDVVEIEPRGAMSVEIPLKLIKEYERCDILKRSIPIHFREIFAKRRYFFYEYNGEEKVLTKYISTKVD